GVVVAARPEPPAVPERPSRSAGPAVATERGNRKGLAQHPRQFAEQRSARERDPARLRGATHPRPAVQEGPRPARGAGTRGGRRPEGARPGLAAAYTDQPREPVPPVEREHPGASAGAVRTVAAQAGL